MIPEQFEEQGRLKDNLVLGATASELGINRRAVRTLDSRAL